MRALEGQVQDGRHHCVRLVGTVMEVHAELGIVMEVYAKLVLIYVLVVAIWDIRQRFFLWLHDSSCGHPGHRPL